MFFCWISCQEKDVIFLSQKTLQEFKIGSRKITLHFGAWKKLLSVRLHEEIDENTIGLSQHLADECTIPDTLPYDIYLNGEHLYLGPVIAFFVGKGYLEA